MLRRYRWWLAYVAADLLAVGMGMGVPVFCIALGIPVGWWVARRALARGHRTRATLSRLLTVAAWTGGITAVAMAALWAPMVTHLSDPEWIEKTSGIPLIFYQPVPSLAGWLVLMVLVSPVLQVLVTVFAGVLTVIRTQPRAVRAGGGDRLPQQRRQPAA